MIIFWTGLIVLLALGCIDWSAPRQSHKTGKSVLSQPRDKKGRYTNKPDRTVFINDDWKESL